MSSADLEVIAPGRRELVLSPVMDVNTARARLKEFQEFVEGYLQESRDGGQDGGDYGIIPGTKKKTLLKSGADKLCELYGLYDEYVFTAVVEDWERGLFFYRLTCVLKSRRDDSIVGSGVGSCSSFESKYRWRDAKRLCPQCGNSTIIKGQEKFGGGWICWKKEGRSDGCGAKFKIGDQSIEGQVVGRIENPDIIDIANTVLKIAKKRAKVDGVIGVTRSSGIFTQDEELVGTIRDIKPEVARTTEDEEIGGKTRTVLANASGEASSSRVVLSATDTPREHNDGATENNQDTMSRSSVPAAPDTKPKVEVPGADCISVGEAANFHRMFKDSLPVKIRKQAEELAHDWLRVQGIVDVLGKPSALAIKKASFYDVREQAVQFAQTFSV